MSRAHEIRKRHRQILGPIVLAHIEAKVAAAPPPPAEVIEDLRRIFTQPAGEIPVAVPAPAAQAA
ncbi:hypothetical protein ACFCZV_13455 [Streptomyces hydrogenans]|uniref:hypothetical protein n=1 Tax=Streptomyces hydrogenans TaxID=1873719 RepID=UPI0035DAF7E5